MPTLTVRVSGDGMTSFGQRKSFQTAVTAKIATTPRIGRDIGRTIDQSVRSGVAPSITAAAIRSSGIESKNRFSRKMLNAFATSGSQIANGESSRLTRTMGRSITVTYCGTMSTIAGIISVASIMPRISLPSTGRSFDSAYAAAVSNTSWNSTAPAA